MEEKREEKREREREREEEKRGREGEEEREERREEEEDGLCATEKKKRGGEEVPTYYTTTAYALRDRLPSATRGAFHHTLLAVFSHFVWHWRCLPALSASSPSSGTLCLSSLCALLPSALPHWNRTAHAPRAGQCSSLWDVLGCVNDASACELCFAWRYLLCLKRRAICRLLLMQTGRGLTLSCLFSNGGLRCDFILHAVMQEELTPAWPCMQLGRGAHSNLTSCACTEACSMPFCYHLLSPLPILQQHASA